MKRLFQYKTHVFLKYFDHKIVSQLKHCLIKMSSSLVSKFQSSLNLKESNESCGQPKRGSPQLGAMITKICHKYKEVSIDTINYVFHREFLYPLNQNKENFESIEELIECLIRDNYPIEWQQNRDGIQCLRTTRQYFYWLSVIKCNRSYDLMDILADIPEDVISCGQQLPEFEFPKEFSFNKYPNLYSGDSLNKLNYSEVRLMSARSPHEFYLNIYGEDYHIAYHRLMFEMRVYDNKENDEKYRIPSLLLFEGLLCAVKYQKICDEWHRSRLLSIDKQNKCRLFLVDIGDVIETDAKNLRLLLNKFAKLPAQALKAQLVGIRPLPAANSGKKWSNWAKNMVIKLEDDKYCGQMQCSFIDFRSDRYRVCLKYNDSYMSSDKNDMIFLHQILINKRLATTSTDDTPID